MIDPEIGQKLKERIVAEDLNIFPKDIVLESTTFCNLNCAMCSQSKITRKKGQMSWPLYIKIVEEIAEKAKDSTRLWLCFYGEPLMRKDLPDMVLFAKQRGIKNVVINSNMNLMLTETAEQLVKNGLNTIFVGLDACTPEVYEQIRCGGNYDKVVNNILNYKEALNKFGKPDQQVIIQFIELDKNKHQKEQMVDFWHKHGIAVKIRPSVTWQGTNELERIHMDKNRLPCHWLMNILPVTPEGNCVYCGCDYDGKAIRGNLTDNSIYEIWNTAKKDDRLIHLNHEWDKTPDFCRNCSDWIGAYAKYE